MWPRHWGGHKASDGVFGKDVVLVVWLVLYVCEGATKLGDWEYMRQWKR